MNFVVQLSNKQRHLMTEELIRDHVEYLRQLKQTGALPFCGPCQDGTAIMILDCDSIQEAHKIVDHDPFSKVGYYTSRKIVGVEEANENNNFHLEKVLHYLTSHTS